MLLSTLPHSQVSLKMEEVVIFWRFELIRFYLHTLISFLLCFLYYEYLMTTVLLAYQLLNFVHLIDVCFIWIVTDKTEWRWTHVAGDRISFEKFCWKTGGWIYFLISQAGFGRELHRISWLTLFAAWQCCDEPQIFNFLWGSFIASVGLFTFLDSVEARTKKCGRWWL